MFSKLYRCFSIEADVYWSIEVAGVVFPTRMDYFAKINKQNFKSTTNRFSFCICAYSFQLKAKQKNVSDSTLFGFVFFSFSITNRPTY